MKFNLSISHLGWRRDENRNIIKVIKKNKIKNIDIVLGRYFQDIENIDNKKIITLKNFWNNKNIKIHGMQSILYGYEDLNIFNSESDRNKLIAVIRNIGKIAKKLDVKFITFGCPKNRFRSKNQSIELAVNFFKKVSQNLPKDLDLCIEPIPKIYGNNFLINTIAVFNFLKKVNKKNILCQLDMSAIKINKESLNNILKFKKFIGHIHISDNNLGKIEYSKENIKILTYFYKHFEKKILTIEILGNKKFNLELVKSSIKNINRISNEL